MLVPHLRPDQVNHPAVRATSAGLGAPDVGAADRRDRVTEVIELLADLLTVHADRAAAPAGRSLAVLVDGRGEPAAAFADRLAGRLPAHVRVYRERASPPTSGWDVVIHLRAARSDGDRRPVGPGTEVGVGVSGTGPDERGGELDRAGEDGATVVVDHHDPGWPVIRQVHPDLADRDRWYLSENRAFFAVRAASWDTRFGSDLPAYAAAIADGGIRSGDRVLDVGCGTGRALPALREAVGERGAVLGLDVTPQMLAVARAGGRARQATLVLADARHLPVATGAVDAILAAGLVSHLPDRRAGLSELARVTRAGGTLVLFHPSGRAALAARHGRTLRPDEPLARGQLGPLLAATGWHLVRYDDPPHRFLALARRSA